MIQRRIDELKMRRALEIEHASDFGLANSLSYAIAELEKIRDALLPDVVATLEMAEKTLADLPEIGTQDAYKLASMVRATLALVKPS